jgi:hypothetical protein
VRRRETSSGLVGKPEGKRLLESHKHRFEDNIKTKVYKDN